MQPRDRPRGTTSLVEMKIHKSVNSHHTGNTVLAPWLSVRYSVRRTTAHVLLQTLVKKFKWIPRSNLRAVTRYTLQLSFPCAEDPRNCNKVSGDASNCDFFRMRGHFFSSSYPLRLFFILTLTGSHSFVTEWRCSGSSTYIRNVLENRICRSVF